MREKGSSAPRGELEESVARKHASEATTMALKLRGQTSPEVQDKGISHGCILNYELI